MRFGWTIMSFGILLMQNAHWIDKPAAADEWVSIAAPVADVEHVQYIDLAPEDEDVIFIADHRQYDTPQTPADVSGSLDPPPKDVPQAHRPVYHAQPQAADCGQAVQYQRVYHAAECAQPAVQYAECAQQQDVYAARGPVRRVGGFVRQRLFRGRLLAGRLGGCN